MNLDEIVKRIAGAANERKFDAVITLAGAAKEMETLEKRQKEIEAKLGNLDNLPPAPSANQWRKALIEATPGSVTYGYLLVSGPLRKKVLKPSEILKVRIPLTGETFTSSIYWKNKYLREREAVGRFYKAAGIKAGDMIALTEVAPNEWTLTKAEGMGQV